MPKEERSHGSRFHSRSHPYKENRSGNAPMTTRTGDTSSNTQPLKPAVAGASRSSAKHEKRSKTENADRMLEQRQKQIDYGKNTLGYQRYRKTVPREERTLKHPRTPDKHGDYSKRQWDGLVRVWRRALHAYDPPADDTAGGGGEEELCAEDVAAMHGDGGMADLDMDAAQDAIIDDIDLDDLLDSDLTFQQ